MTDLAKSDPPAPPSPTSGVPRGGRRRGDTIFQGLATAAGVLIMVVLAGVAIFLLLESVPALGAKGESAYGNTNIVVFVWPLLYGTLLAAVIAMLIATPLAIGVALVVSHYAPRRIAKPLGFLIDLLAAIPSVVYGIWGRIVLAPAILPLYKWLADHLSWLPFFEGPARTGGTILTVGIVLAVMALPIITAICREVFLQTPRMNEEAALALGATRWEMIRMTVFPYARSGIVSAVMLGLGRAIGETMAVALILSPAYVVSINLISQQNPVGIAANIALNFGNASGTKINVLIFSGLVLFVVSFAVNYLGRYIAGRGEKKLQRGTT